MRVLATRRVLFIAIVALLLPLGRLTPAVQAAAVGTTAGIAPVVAVAAPASSQSIDQQRNDKLAVVREAFDLLYGGYIFPLRSDLLLADAWDGVNTALAAAGAEAAPAPAFTGNADTDWMAFAAAFRRVVDAGAATPDSLAYGAIGQMASARNSCHTAFFDPVRAATLNGSGNHQPTVDTGFVAGRMNNLVYRVYPGSAAARAGLQEGDTLLTSDGQGDPGIRRRLLTGKADVPVSVTVQRPGVADPIELTIVPEVTVLPFIRTRILAGGIGVIQWDEFTSGAGMVDAIRQALTGFEAQGVAGWILDLRTSPGGSSSTEAAIANLFVANGWLATGIDRAGGVAYFDAEPAAAFSVQRPLAVLVENFSASAADILPGTLQDDGRAYLIGETTDGCVSSSIIETLVDGSALQVEVERVLIGKDSLDLDGIGVTPNETVVRTPELLAAGVDPQLDRAVQYLLGQAGR